MKEGVREGVEGVRGWDRGCLIGYMKCVREHTRTRVFQKLSGRRKMYCIVMYCTYQGVSGCEQDGSM